MVQVMIEQVETPAGVQDETMGNVEQDLVDTRGDGGQKSIATDSVSVCRRSVNVRCHCAAECVSCIHDGQEYEGLVEQDCRQHVSE